MAQNTNMSARELYQLAHELHKANHKSLFIETCEILFCNFPDSDEANWAIKRFKLTEQDITDFQGSLSKLISCPDCKQEVSRKAASCPNCGRVINDQFAIKAKNTSSPFALSCLFISIISMFTPAILAIVVVATAVILGIFSLMKREKQGKIAVIGIVLSLLVLLFVNKQLDEVQNLLLNL